MRKLAYSFLALSLMLSSTPASAQQPRAVWEWTDDERIAARLDPVSIKARALAHRGSGESSNSAAQTPMSAADSPPPFVIDGSRNPELFLPWELMDSLLGVMGGDSVQRRHRQRAYASALAAFEWDETTFWWQIEQLSRAYVEADAARINILMRVPHRQDGPTGEARLEVDRLGRRICSERAAVLQAARATFGRVKFDRFLYTVVAPRIGMASNPPTDAATLRWIEAGCR